MTELQLISTPIEDVNLQFTKGGRISKATSKTLRALGFKYCPTCKRVMSMDYFSLNRAKCDDCVRKVDYPNQVKWLKKRWPQQRLVNEVNKLNAIAELGGKCSRCGYHEFLGGLSFHHVVPSLKKLQPVRVLDSRYRTSIDELDKCALLCTNCHFSLERGDYKARFRRRASGFGYEWIADECNTEAMEKP